MQDGGMMMNSNIKSVISKCEKDNNGEVFLCLKLKIPHIAVGYSEQIMKIRKDLVVWIYHVHHTLYVQR